MYRRRRVKSKLKLKRGKSQKKKIKCKIHPKMLLDFFSPTTKYTNFHHFNIIIFAHFPIRRWRKVAIFEEANFPFPSQKCSKPILRIIKFCRFCLSICTLSHSKEEAILVLRMPTKSHKFIHS